MAVMIDQIDVDSSAEPASSNSAPAEPEKTDPREIERALNRQRERLARVRAH
jgi:hypothetical protein